jgi:hypothetical protein
MANSPKSIRSQELSRLGHIFSAIYSQFQHNYGPNHRVLKEKKFVWSTTAAKAFTEIKKKMGQAPVLKLPNFSKIFEVACDASHVGIRGGAKSGRPSHCFL